ncbi:LacI family transcriptional regulator [Geodermatophilus sp. YIM 151500]|uniref:LacI family DNA-binding transcriptional regulator n=1 Tax=Geodermatophilus sp. YIM 151500 TaxID=2984531 RepID=UPI0021E3FEC4|nr:LacI family DNA-binding transcriptional regulator [Geodermatophilus sp. YIM 151500]MCV2490847.1 LacI family transcriptional regulator [Geodermatophilus sp. YIM 151500]
MTIRDVAARAQVSTATVSRALSGARRVSPDVVQQVRRAAEDLGYSGNGIASALRRSRTDTVGMVVPSIANPFFTSLVESVEHALQQAGRQLFLCSSRSDPDLEAQRVRSLVARQVDGIVISPVHGTDSTEAVGWAAAELPLVQVDRYVRGVPTDWVGVDDDAGLGLVVEHLAARGVRSAAFVSSQLTNSSTELRLAGFRRHTERLGIAVGRGSVLLGEYSIDWGRKAAAALLGSGRLPDAVVCADDLIALGVLQTCSEAGVAVPGEVLVTGFDDIPFSALSAPPLTTVRQPQELIAAEAVRLLQQALGRVPGEPARVALPPSLVVRASTG